VCCTRAPSPGPVTSRLIGWVGAPAALCELEAPCLSRAAAAVRWNRGLLGSGEALSRWLQLSGRNRGLLGSGEALSRRLYLWKPAAGMPWMPCMQRVQQEVLEEHAPACLVSRTAPGQARGVCQLPPCTPPESSGVGAGSRALSACRITLFVSLHPRASHAPLPCIRRTSAPIARGC